ncbi:MAG: IclR family transcriptional regulator [Paracoccaceae bacterium]|nr:IclR family transcriptional regulator [Paracoccaceae bacterium]
MAADGTDRTDNIPTNMRLLIMLEEIARADVTITPTEVNTILKLPKPTIHRLFSTLDAEGFLQRDLDGRSYSPGLRLRRLSSNVLSSLRIRTARLAVLNALAEEIGETCNIATPDRDAMTYLDRVETKWPLRIQLPVGTAVPFYCTASGKLYLSTLTPTHLDRYLSSATLTAQTEKTVTDPTALRDEITSIRKNGYSTDDEEFMASMAAIAVPILDDQNRLLSTLSVHAPVQRISLQDLRAFVPRLHDAATELAQLLLSDQL